MMYFPLCTVTPLPAWAFEREGEEPVMLFEGPNGSYAHEVRDAIRLREMPPTCAEEAMDGHEYIDTLRMRLGIGPVGAEQLRVDGRTCSCGKALEIARACDLVQKMPSPRLDLMSQNEPMVT